MNTAAPAVQPEIDFVFPSSACLLFARASIITDTDPSAMRTFRLDPNVAAQKERPPVRAAVTADGRNVLISSDWSGSPTVVNGDGFTLLNAA